MSTFIVTAQSPNTVNWWSDATGNQVPTPLTPTTPTPEPESINIPSGATSVTLLNRGTASADYGLDVTPATALTAGESVVVALTPVHKKLTFQGLNLLVDCIFTVTDV